MASDWGQFQKARPTACSTAESQKSDAQGQKPDQKNCILATSIYRTF